ncbi:hypothetical protein OFM39_28635, partial [Escherichia coli]|nr:hypothetical protein [Escherichia coli]
MQYVSQAAQILYGLCNWECIKKFELSIGKLRETKGSQIDLVDENLRVLKLQAEAIKEQVGLLKLTTANLASLVNVT